MTDFVHLHLHTEYSLLDGACRVSEIPDAVKKAGQNAVCVTDHGVMYGAVAFYRACRDAGIKPVIGCEVYVAPGSRFEKSGGRSEAYHHLVLLVKNADGYRNLIYMVSKGFSEGFYTRPRIDLELLSSHSEGLIALSGCIGGYIPQCIIGGDISGAEEYARKLNEIMGEGNFYLEIQDHGIAGEKAVTAGLCRLSEKLSIPLCATNDVHYLKKSDAGTQATLMCIQTNSRLADGRPLGFETDEFYLKTGDEMEELFKKYPEALSNTVKIAEECNFDFEFDKRYLPAFSPPGGEAPGEYLRRLCTEGFERRIKNRDIVFDKNKREIYEKRIEYELSVIGSMGFDEYFLIVCDFVNWAKEHGVPTGPGRGSGAGSLVAYLIRITEIDPVEYDLLFEAFLNPERVSMPDFDIDFSDTKRELVYGYVTEKYGRDHVSHIGAFGTFAARESVRSVGRALGMGYSETDAVAKLIPQRPGITLTKCLGAELKDIYSRDESVKRLIDIALKIEGMPRNTTVHAAGVVITDRPVNEHVPLCGDSESVLTQFDMDTVAALGLLKFDFLGIRYLTVIDDAARIAGIDIEKIPLDDKKTYDLLSSGKTEGLFQLESGGMKQLLTNLKPDCIRDIMTAIALYRPGPMDFIPQYLSNRKNPANIHYDIEGLSDILSETYGCIVYQEQVMQIFCSVAGYTYGHADIVRRAISKKKAGVIEKERESFISGAVSKGARKEDAELLFENMLGFSNYGFKKGHAAAYGVVSYRTAYLKANYPAVYFSALMSSVIGRETKLSDYISDAARIGIKVLAPDINKSGVYFTVSGDNIAFGLLALKNVGINFVKALVSERAMGEYKSFDDFIVRTVRFDLNRRAIESFIKAGAFDSFGKERSTLLLCCDAVISLAQEEKKRTLSGQLDMFSESGESRIVFEYPEGEPLSLRQKLIMEKEAAGFCFSGHLLDEYSKMTASQKCVPIRKLFSAVESGDGAFGDGKSVTVAGIITRRVGKQTKSGENMAFVTVEDGSAAMETVIFPKILTQFSSVLLLDRAVSLTGKISVKEDEDPKLLASGIVPLKPDSEFSAEKKSEEKPKTLYLRHGGENTPEYKKAIALIEIFSGVTPVVLFDRESGKYIRMRGIGADATRFLQNELFSLLGEENVILK